MKAPKNEYLSLLKNAMQTSTFSVTQLDMLCSSDGKVWINVDISEEDNFIRQSLLPQEKE
jgi:hypothetical protein